jgi:hypothetical protein
VERPDVTTLRFDVDALPVAEWGPPARGSGFSLQASQDGWTVRLRPRLFAELAVSMPPSRQRSAGNFTSFNGFTTFTGASGFGVGEVPRCGAGHVGAGIAAWSGFSPRDWTEDGMNVELDSGDYDLQTCHARPRRSLVGRARAIVRGFVYALRAREQGDDGRPLESLVVFLPRGAMVSTAADPATTVQAANTGPFTRLTFPLRDASAGTANLRLSPLSMRLWRYLQQGLRAFAVVDAARFQDDLLVGIDVASQGDRRIGSIAVALPEGQDAKPYAKLLEAMR